MATSAGEAPFRAAGATGRVGEQFASTGNHMRFRLRKVLNAERLAFSPGRVFRDFRQLMIENCGSEPIRLLGLMLGHIADRQLPMLAEKQPAWEVRADSDRRAVRMKEELIAALEQHDAAAAKAIWDGYLTFYVYELKSITADFLRDASPSPLGC